MNPNTLRIGIDVGGVRHRVAVGLPDGTLIDEFDVDHHAAGFNGFNRFFHRIAALEARHPLPVSVAMGSYHGKLPWLGATARWADSPASGY
jgi:hypothetical protein